MREINELIHELTWPAIHPMEAIKQEMETGKKQAVGCFLGFCPEELVYGAGLLPVGIWGMERRVYRAEEYFPAFFCSPVKSMIDLAASGAYRGLLSAMIMPVYCDALRSAGQNFKIAVPYIPMIPVVYPVNRKSSAGVNFLASEFANVRESLEKIIGEKSSEQSLEEAITVYNHYRSAMREFVKTAVDYPELITPRIRHQIIQSACYTDKKTYTGKIERLTETLKKSPAQASDWKKVILTGIKLSSEEILMEMEGQKLSVVSDYLLQESLQIQMDVPKRYGDATEPLLRLAGRFGCLEFCSVLLDPEKKRAEQITKDALKSGAGVMVCIPSFCNPEEYDYPILKKTFEEAGVPHICLEIQSDSETEQAKIKLQAFAEMLCEDRVPR